MSVERTERAVLADLNAALEAIEYLEGPDVEKAVRLLGNAIVRLEEGPERPYGEYPIAEIIAAFWYEWTDKRGPIEATETDYACADFLLGVFDITPRKKEENAK